jgi:hypothetical protein
MTPVKIQRIAQKDRDGRCHLQNHSSIDWRVHIERDLLPTFVSRAFQPSSPEHHGHTDEQRFVGRVLSDTGPPPESVLCSRRRGLPRTQNRPTGPTQEPVRIEVHRIVVVCRGIMVALLHVREENGPLGMRIPSYKSSSVVVCAMPRGAAGRHRRVSLTNARRWNSTPWVPCILGCYNDDEGCN